MARLPPLAYLNDPEEEERRALLLQEAYGPPPPPPNLGVMDREAMREADAAARQDPLARNGITTEDIEAAAARGEQVWTETPAMRARLDQMAAEDEEEATVAADTAEERDTPPSGQEMNVSISPGELSLHGYNPLAELERVRALGPRDWRNVSYQTMNKGGPNPDLMGYEHPASARDAASARAGELYGAATPTARWEDDFLANHGRSSDDDIRARSALATLLGGTEEGRRLAETEREQSRNYDQGLFQARERDRGEQRISKGLAQAIAGANLGVSPEEAVQLRMNDPIVKSFTNGGYSQGLRGEGQQISITKKVWDIMAKLGIEGAQHQHEIEKLLLRGATDMEIANIYAKSRTPAVAEDPQDPDSSGLLGSLLSNAVAGMTPEQGAAVARGDTSELTPEQQDEVGRVLPSLRATLADPKTRARLLTTFSAQATTGERKKRLATEQSIAIAKAAPHKRKEYKDKWNAAAIPLKEAWGAWNQLSPDGQKAFAQWAAGGFTGKIRTFLMTEGDRERIGAVQGVINALVKDRSGSAVTGSEWERIAEEIGLEADNWNPFNSPTSITNHLLRSARLLTAHRQTFEQEIGDW